MQWYLATGFAVNIDDFKQLCWLGSRKNPISGITRYCLRSRMTIMNMTIYNPNICLIGSSLSLELLISIWTTDSEGMLTKRIQYQVCQIQGGIQHKYQY
jgi:hypothetical protein